MTTTTTTRKRRSRRDTENWNKSNRQSLMLLYIGTFRTECAVVGCIEEEEDEKAALRQRAPSMGARTGPSSSLM